MEWRRQRLIDLATLAGSRTLEIYFAAAYYLTAEDLGSLLMVREKISAQGGQLVLSCMDEQLREIFAITRLDRVFDILGEGELDARDLVARCPTI